MDNSSTSGPQQEGRKTWEAFKDQANEASGFFSAMIYSIIRFLKKNILKALVLAVIGGAAGWSLAYLQKPGYEAQMTLSYAHLEKKIYADMINKLNVLIQNGQVSDLVALLEWEEEKVRKIKRIDSKNIHYQPLIQDISTEKVPFYIVVEVSDYQLLSELEQKIISYLNSSSFVQERLAHNKSNLINEITFLKSQIENLQSLQEKYNMQENKGSEWLANMERLTQDEYSYFKQLRELESGLKFNYNLEVLDPFVPQKTSTKDTYLKHIASGVGAGLLLSLFIPLFRKRA